MSNPRRTRNIALAFFASGVALASVYFALPKSVVQESAIGILLILYWPNALLFGAITAVVNHRATGTQQSLFRGDDVLARWHVDGNAWSQFAALNRQLNETPDALPDEVDATLDESPAGINVIAGKSAVQIGDRFHSLPVRGTPEITQATLRAPETSPPYIELRLYYPGGGEIAYPPRWTILRVPVAQDAWRDARRVTAHYNRDLPGTPDFFHGRGDGSNPEDLSTCYACGFQTHKFISHCPRCGGGMLSRRWSRRFGWILLLCGLFITGMMLAVLWNTGPHLLAPGVQIDGSRFTGTRFQARLILGLLIFVTLFGAFSLAYGAWQVRTGGRSLRAIRTIIGMAAILLFAAIAVGFLLD